MESSKISDLATQIRSSTKAKPNILTLSTTALWYLLSSFDMIEDQCTSSFHVKQPHNFKAELIRDLQFLSDYFQQAETLKLYGDSDETPEFIDISKFKQAMCVELHKVDVNSVKGLQTLRSQIQKLVCQKATNSLWEVLSDCGGDKSRGSCWNDLKEASFTSNNITSLDESVECAPWLHTLDLSHNQITNIEALASLPNLKYLNLSYNKIEAVPQLRGQICARLQNLILKNNFIEDVSGLRSLTNLWVLDLSNNCLVDHKSLLVLSYLAALQWLNLQANPLSFHPNHRHRTACYLHANTASTHFVLNNAPLSKNEKKLVGTLYPSQAKSDSFANSSVNLGSSRAKRVRHVVIEDGDSVRDTAKVLPPTPQQHLETKKQIEDLHEKFGESWLNFQSGLVDVLGLESFSSPMPGTSPYEADFTIYSGDFSVNAQPEEAVEVQETSEELNEEYNKQESTLDESLDDVEDEESIYLAKVKTDETEIEIFLVIGQTHLSERECSTGNERDKWHLESILNCEIVDGTKTVRIDFETMRKDRKQRLYMFEEEIEAFVECIKKRMNTREPRKEDGVLYLCMKCNTVFRRIENGTVLGESALECPSCDSTLVVEA